MNSSGAAPACLAGIGLKPAHVAQVLGAAGPAAAALAPAAASAAAAAAGAGTDLPALDFFELHAENHMVAGGPQLRVLDRLRQRWPLSLHGVGLSIGGEGALDAEHLGRLTALVQRFEPRWVSEHLAWSSHGGVWLNDLLPLPYNGATLARVCAHVDEVQARLRRPILLENPSTYVEFEASSFSEAQFLIEVQGRTGCGLLLDINNAYVSAVNHGRDAWSFIEALPAQAIGEIHLAGFARDEDALGALLLIDDHGHPVDDAVWALYRRALALFGPRPTLIERDNNLPSLADLAAEAARARQLQQRATAAAFGQALPA